jgi:hypothetical protein
VSLIAFCFFSPRSWTTNVCHINSWGCGHCQNKGLC